jgi:hypothetical protein
MHDARATADELMNRIGEAASGLLFPSESDFPLTPFRWSGGAAGAVLSEEGLLRSEGREPGTPIEVASAEELFAPVTEAQEEGDASEASRYRALLALLKGELDDLRTYRMGKVDIDVYVLGRHASGEWLGLKTHVVET